MSEPGAWADMKFRIQVTSGVEVKFADWPKDHAVDDDASSDTGLWRVDIRKFEAFVAAKLDPLTFGSSIDEFRFGFEIAELEAWGAVFTTMANYMSYRPKSRSFISVGQLEWLQVKDLSAQEQLSRLSDALIAAVERIGTAKRKPKDFDHAALAQALRDILQSCDASVLAGS